MDALDSNIQHDWLIISKRGFDDAMATFNRWDPTYPVIDSHHRIGQNDHGVVSFTFDLADTYNRDQTKFIGDVFGRAFSLDNGAHWHGSPQISFIDFMTAMYVPY